MTLFFTAFWILLNGLRDTVPLLLAAALHEAGHAIACFALRVPIRFFAPSPLGAVIGYDSLKIPYASEAVIALAGPAAGLLGTALSLLLPAGRYTVLFSLSSLALSLFNLLPVKPLDGFVFLRAVLYRAADPYCGERILRTMSAAGTVLLWMFAAAVQLRCGGNLSLLLISVYMILSLAQCG